MGVSLQKNIDIYIRRDFIFKKNIYNPKKLFVLKGLNLRIVVNQSVSFDLPKVLEIIFLIEYLAGNKVYVLMKKSNVYNKGFNIIIRLMIRALKMYYLLNYLSIVYVPVMVKKTGMFTQILNKNIISLLAIKDKNLFHMFTVYKNFYEILYIYLYAFFLKKVDCLYFIQAIKLYIKL